MFKIETFTTMTAGHWGDYNFEKQAQADRLSSESQSSPVHATKSLRMPTWKRRSHGAKKRQHIKRNRTPQKRALLNNLLSLKLQRHDVRPGTLCDEGRLPYSSVRIDGDIRDLFYVSLSIGRFLPPEIGRRFCAISVISISSNSRVVKLTYV